MKVQKKLHLKASQICLASLVLCANALPAHANTAGDKLGSVKQIMLQLEQQDAARSSAGSVLMSPFGRAKESKERPMQRNTWLNQFSITNVEKSGDSIQIEAKDLKNPRLFMRLSGNGSKLQGRITDFANRQVFELSTDDNGELRRVQVPASKYFADMDDEWVASKLEAKKFLKTRSGSEQNSRVLKRIDNGVSSFSSYVSDTHPVHVVPFRDGTDLRKLQSRPGSKYVVFLDQEEILNARGDVLAINSADDEDEPLVLNNITKADVYRVWQVVSSQYSMFDLNITTDKAVFDKAETAKKLRLRYQNRACTSNQAYNSFGKKYSEDNGQTCMDSENNDHWALGVGLTIAHELGHAMGLGHDGDSDGNKYFKGLSDAAWVPLMGHFWYGFGWSDALVQFSKGEYRNAVTEKYPNQDDFVQIGTKVPKLSALSAPKALQVIGENIEPRSNFGQVVTSEDKPKFTFNVASPSRLSLRAEPIEVFGSLDINMRVLDSNGAVVANSVSNIAKDRSAEISNLNLPAGNYSIEVSGGAELTPRTGFSNYASMGHFAMKGTLKSAALPVDVTKTFPAVNGSVEKWTYYKIDVPAGKKLTVSTTATSGDPDLFVRKDSNPTLDNYACKSDTSSAAESCSTTNTSTSARSYYIGIYHYTATTGVVAKAVISN